LFHFAFQESADLLASGFLAFGHVRAISHNYSSVCLYGSIGSKITKSSLANAKSEDAFARLGVLKKIVLGIGPDVSSKPHYDRIP
jgi:hypothetical protein